MVNKCTAALVVVLAGGLTGGCAVISRSSQAPAPVEGVNGVEESIFDPNVATTSDGRYVAFHSASVNLVPNDTNNAADVFLRDRVAGTTTRVSVDSGGGQGNGNSRYPSVSDDGRYVAFMSHATNLVANDSNSASDVFVYDRQTDVTSRVSLDSFGAQGNQLSTYPAISGDGRYVAFSSLATNLVPGDSNLLYDWFVRDRQTNQTTRTSLTVAGGQSEGSIRPSRPAISDDGRYVAFSSEADDLLGAGVDTNGTTDVFIRDRTTAATSRVSVGAGSIEANAESASVAMSGDGRYVGFTSKASNLVVDDTNGQFDAFLRDRQGGTTQRVSVATGGAEVLQPSQYASVSDDGRYVAFSSDGTLVPGDNNSVRDVFVRDRTAATTTRVSVKSGGQQAAGGPSDRPVISDDGGVVAFLSAKTNLVGDDSNAFDDAFAHVRTTTTTVRISVASDQANGDSSSASASDDGRYVAFSSEAANLVPRDTNGQVDVFVRDHLTGAVERVSVDSAGGQANGNSGLPAISGDARFVAFQSSASNLVPGDTNNALDVFVHDRLTGSTERSSVSSGAAQGNSSSVRPSISDDGRYVVFESNATTHVGGDTNDDDDVFLRDRLIGVTSLVSRASGGTQGNAGSSWAVISGDGRYVAFRSDASNLVAGDTNGVVDVFRRDLVTNTTIRVSITTLGVQGNDDSYEPAISDDGDAIVFESEATNLVAGDTNVFNDVFVRQLCGSDVCPPIGTARVSVGTTGTQANNTSGKPSISDDGRFVAFESPANILASGDSNGVYDIFVRDRTKSRTARVSTALFLDQATGGGSIRPAMSGDGRTVAFESAATNLIDGDTNGVTDVFLRAQPVPTVTNVSPNSHADGGPGFAVTITGTNFLAGAQIRFAVAGISAIVNTVNDTTITATFTIALGTAAGPIDVYVANPGTGPGPTFAAMGRCTGCFTVT